MSETDSELNVLRVGSDSGLQAELHANGSVRRFDCGAIALALFVGNAVEGGPANPLGARGIYLYQGDKDTLFRIHGTNQPEYIGQAISSGCIRMTNEDVIDLYNRVRMGAIVVVLAPGQGRIAAWTPPPPRSGGRS